MRSVRHALSGLCLLVSVASAHAQDAPPVRPPSDQVERAVENVRQATAALKAACAGLPSFKVDSPTPPAPSRPFASEEDTCHFISNPEQALWGFALPIGSMGGLVALLALGFFAFVAGIIRALWHYPMTWFGSAGARRNT